MTMTDLYKILRLWSAWLTRMLFRGGLAYLLQVLFLGCLTGCAYHVASVGRPSFWHRWVGLPASPERRPLCARPCPHSGSPSRRSVGVRGWGERTSGKLTDRGERGRGHAAQTHSHDSDLCALAGSLR